MHRLGARSRRGSILVLATLPVETQAGIATRHQQRLDWRFERQRCHGFVRRQLVGIDADLAEKSGHMTAPQAAHLDRLDLILSLIHI